jgi:hypothetical protein
MAIIHVPMVELLCHTVMGRLPVLKYLLSGAHECLLPRLVVPGIKCCCFSRTRLRWCLSNTESPRVWLLGAWIRPELGRRGRLGWHVVKSCPPMSIEVG